MKQTYKISENFVLTKNLRISNSYLPLFYVERKITLVMEKILLFSICLIATFFYLIIILGYY
jgi:hypothetical protein